MNRPARVRIRYAVPADLDALVALEDAAFAGDRISRRQWRHHVASTRASVLVIGVHGYLDACAVVLRRRGSRRARLYSFAVAPGRRGQGLGGVLLKAAEAEARQRGCDSLSLEVRKDNAAAVVLYAGHGYLQVARVTGFYEDGTDAWRYMKPLTGETSSRR